MKNIKEIAKELIDYEAYLQRIWLKNNPYHNTPYEFICNQFSNRPIVGILYDIAQEHQNYLKACIDLKVNYSLSPPKHPKCNTRDYPGL